MSSPTDRDTPAAHPVASRDSSPVGSPSRTCIVTLEVNGPSRNGGIGTACTALAEKLAAAGHDVTLLYLLGRHSESGTFADWQRHFAERGVRLLSLETADVPLEGSRSLQLSYLAMRRLVEMENAGDVFDIVHIHEWLGFGYYTLLAREQGDVLSRTLICVGLHSPTMWIHRANQVTPDHPDVLECDALERRCVELADVVWSPSRYLLSWCAEQGWAIDRRAWTHPNPAPGEPTTGVAARMPVEELVFFGRLETRKGIVLFCDALDRLVDEGASRTFRVTFLGKACRIDDRDAVEYIRDRASRWGVPVEIRTDLGHREALDSLRRPGCLAVIPSLIENCPLTVIECVSFGIPFLASDVGGIPELIHRDDHDAVLTSPDADALAAGLRAALERGATTARAAMSSQDCDRTWDEWHRTKRRRVVSPRVEQPPVVVRLLDRDACLGEQDYPRLEKSNSSDGFVLFLPGGVRPTSNAVTRLVRAALNADADLVGAFEDVRNGKSVVRRLHAGIASTLGLIRNCYAGSCLLVRATVVETLGEPRTSWDYAARAVSRGFKLHVVPEVLFEIDERPSRRETPPLDVFLDEAPSMYRDLLALAHGQARHVRRLEDRLAAASTRCLRYRIADAIHGAIRRVPVIPRLLKLLLGRLV